MGMTARCVHRCIQLGIRIPYEYEYLYAYGWYRTGTVAGAEELLVRLAGTSR